MELIKKVYQTKEVHDKKEGGRIIMTSYTNDESLEYVEPESSAELVKKVYKYQGYKIEISFNKKVYKDCTIKDTSFVFYKNDNKIMTYICPPFNLADVTKEELEKRIKDMVKDIEKNKTKYKPDTAYKINKLKETVEQAKDEERVPVHIATEMADLLIDIAEEILSKK